MAPDCTLASVRACFFCSLITTIVPYCYYYFLCCTVNDSDISLVIAGSIVNTTNKCSTTTNTVCGSWLANGTANFRDDAYGAQNDLWGLSLTPADVNNVGKYKKEISKKLQFDS